MPYIQPVTARKGCMVYTKATGLQRRSSTVTASKAVKKREANTPHVTTMNCTYSFHLTEQSINDQSNDPAEEKEISLLTYSEGIHIK